MRRVAKAAELAADGAVTALAGPEDGVGVELHRLDLAPESRLEWQAAAAGEHAVYVIAGSGLLEAGGAHFPLGAESVAWLEPGERCVFAAGGQGLRLLAAQAPAG